MINKNSKNDDSKLKNPKAKDFSSDFVKKLDKEIKEAEDENDQIQEKVDKEIVEIVQDVDEVMVKLVKDTE